MSHQFVCDVNISENRVMVVVAAALELEFVQRSEEFILFSMNI